MKFPKGMSPYRVNGKYIPWSRLLEFEDSSSYLQNSDRIRENFGKDGYLFFRDFIPKDFANKAKNEIIQSLEEVGEVDGSYKHPISTGKSERKSKVKDLGDFWKSVSEGEHLRSVTHGRYLSDLASRVRNKQCVAFDFVFLRIGVPGRFTHIHCDYPFFTRLTEEVVTIWIALSDVPADLGPLYIIKGSDQFEDHLSTTRGFDLMKQTDRQASILDHPADYVEKRGTKLLTKEFLAGDVLLFNMFIQHGSFENYSPKNQIRITCDVRFQPDEDAKDPRYFGSNPTGTTGSGYGELNAAKPLDEPGHIR